MEPDRLQLTLLKLAEQIHQKEKVIADLTVELAELRAKANKLDEAKVILAEMGDAGEPAMLRRHLETLQAVSKRFAAPTPSLREEVLKCLGESMDRNDGLLIGEIRSWLKMHNYPVTTERNFYSAVHITLKRLTDQGRVKILEIEGTRHYVLIPEVSAWPWEDKKKSDVN